MAIPPNKPLTSLGSKVGGVIITPNPTVGALKASKTDKNAIIDDIAYKIKEAPEFGVAYARYSCFRKWVNGAYNELITGEEDWPCCGTHRAWEGKDNVSPRYCTKSCRLWHEGLYNPLHEGRYVFR